MKSFVSWYQYVVSIVSGLAAGTALAMLRRTVMVSRRGLENCMLSLRWLDDEKLRGCENNALNEGDVLSIYGGESGLGCTGTSVFYRTIM